MKHHSKILTKSFLFFFILMICIRIYGNMAKPYSDGTTSSPIFGSKDCKVLSEKMDLTVVASEMYDDYSEFYRVKYKVSYQIYSEKEAKLPLLFIAQNMASESTVSVNGKKINTPKITNQNISQFSFIHKNQNSEDSYDIRFEQNSPKYVNLNELIYFETDLEKGENNIVVEYEGVPEYNIYGLLREFKISYALYPSNYWKSFGPIEINLHIPPGLEVNSTNISKLQEGQNGNYKMQINEITQEELEIKFSKKVSVLGKILLFLQPIGIMTIGFLIMVYFHIRWILNRRRKQPKKFNYTVLLGSLIIAILTSLVFIFSYDFIQWVVDEQGMKQGYVLLAVFVIFPCILIFYTLFAWIIDFWYKIKINQHTN
ncbi:hypothetical protein HZP54_13800 [Elizabethkingia anophelis]|nr:hypothetical protein [Elizabethkingia anophelis]MCT4234199.1 hypothetical protein [Elizabethkingia anophelis]